MLNIGTAKPTPEQQHAVPHRCIDIVGPEEGYNAGRFEQDGMKAVQEALGAGRIPLVVGGSGLYIRALLQGLTPLPSKDEELRRMLEEKYEEEGEEGLRRMLLEVDPQAAASIENGKPRRLIRALEVYHLTGKPMSELHGKDIQGRPFEPLVFGLTVPRDELNARIARRTEHMVAEGLVQEVRDVLGSGVPGTAQSLHTVGYREAIRHIAGELDEKEMAELIQRSTRQFAKRQMTWFRGERDVEWIDASHGRTCESIADEVLEKCETGGKM